MGAPPTWLICQWPPEKTVCLWAIINPHFLPLYVQCLSILEYYIPTYVMCGNMIKYINSAIYLSTGLTIIMDLKMEPCSSSGRQAVVLKAHCPFQDEASKPGLPLVTPEWKVIWITMVFWIKVFREFYNTSHRYIHTQLAYHSPVFFYISTQYASLRMYSPQEVM